MIREPWIIDRARHMIEFNGNVVYRVYSSKPYEIYKEREF